MKKIPNNPIGFGLYLTRMHLKWAIPALYCVFVARALDSSAVLVLKNFTDMIAVGNYHTNAIWMNAIAFPLMFLIAHFHWRGSGFTGMQWFVNLRTSAYLKLYEYLSLHSKGYFNNRFAGSLTNKIAHAVDGTETIFENTLWSFLPLCMGLVWYIIIAWRENYILGLILTGWAIFFIVYNVLGVLYAKPKYVRSAETLSTLKGRVVDSLSNISLVHEYANLSGERSYINKYVGKHKKASIQSWTTSEIILSISGVFIFIFISSMILTSIYLLRNDVITIGTVVMITYMTVNLYSQFLFLGFELRDVTRFYGEAQEGLTEILQSHEIVDKPSARAVTIAKGDILLDNVTFQYHKKKVFDRFSLHIPAGQKLGLVGRSGAGKTTFVSLVLRHFEIQSGDIKIDNNSIGDITLESLRKAIAFVPQDTSLFHRTIKENILFGTPHAKESDIRTATDVSQASGFIDELPQGYETLVGERGVKLSGGQRQRIAVARAFLKNAPIVILDEATSSLDSQSEHAIQQAIEKLMSDKTVIAIAHRLSTLKKMDRIIVIENGKIQEDGNPEELLRKENGIFKSMWDHQVNGFIVDEEE